MQRITRTIVACGLACLTLAGVGCKATYTVDVLNSTEQTVSVRLMQDLVAQDSVVLETATIPPGQSATLGPVRATITDDVSIHVGQNELGFPDNHVRLYPGSSSYETVPSSRVWSGVEIIKMTR